MKLKLLKIVATSALLTVTSTALFATDHFINAQQTELKELQKIWEQKNIPEGMQSSKLRETTARDSGAESVSLYARNVNFDIVDNIGFYIEELAATLEPKKAGEPVPFDDVESFTINIHHGKVTVSPEALSALFNKQILDYWPRPLDELTIKTENDYLKADGGLKLWSWFPGIWLPADLGGTITLSDDNKLVYNIDDVRVVGIPLAGLLKMLFIKLTYLLSIDREGAQLGAYELVLDHRSVFPPPALAGNISEVSLSPAGLHLTFSDNKAAQFKKKTPVEKDSYLWIQSGDPRLFGIVVTNAQVAVVSESDTTPLRFNLYDYRKQVAAGVLHMKEDGTIIATLPGDTLKSSASTAASLNSRKSVSSSGECKNSIGFETNCTQ